MWAIYYKNSDYSEPLSGIPFTPHVEQSLFGLSTQVFERDTMSLHG